MQLQKNLVVWHSTLTKDHRCIVKSLTLLEASTLIFSLTVLSFWRQWQNPISHRMSYFSTRAAELAVSICSFILCHSQRKRQLLSVPIRAIRARPSHLWDANMKRIPERSDVCCRSAFKSIIRVSIGLAFKRKKKMQFNFQPPRPTYGKWLNFLFHSFCFFPLWSCI